MDRPDNSSAGQSVPPPTWLGAVPSGSRVQTGDWRRKALHLATAAFPVSYHWGDAKLAAWSAGVLSVVALGVEAARRYPVVNAWIMLRVGGLFRTFEQRGVSGATWLVLGLAVCMAVFPHEVALAAMGFACLADPAASIAGGWSAARRSPDHRGKTMTGSAAFLIVAVAIGIFAFPGRAGIGVLGAFVATLIEHAATSSPAGPQTRRDETVRIDDNLAVPLASGAAMWLALNLAG